MRQVFLKTIMLLGAILCLSVVHNGAITAEEAAKPSEKDTALSGIRFTGGAFVSGLRNEYYVANAEKKITRGAQDQYTLSLGAMAHVPIPPRVRFSGLRGALALSGGIAGDFSTPNGQISAAGQVALGLSLLFDSGEHLFALTAGYIVRPVARLSGYKKGDPFPDPDSSLTRSVYRRGFFLAVTSSFDFQNPFGSNEKKESQQETGTQSGGKSKPDGES